MRYQLSDYEWTAIRPMLPNKPRGVRRVNDRGVLNGIFWVLRSGAPWRDLPGNYGPYTTCYNRFGRWRQAGNWDQIMEALAAGHDAAVQMIDTSVVRVHQHGACIADNNHQDMGRSRGGFTSQIHAVVDTSGLPVHLALTPGETHDNRLCSVLLSALLPQTMLLADRGYDADWIRELARQQGAWANIPPKRNRKDPICFSPYLYRARNLIERRDAFERRQLQTPSRMMTVGVPGSAPREIVRLRSVRTSIANCWPIRRMKSSSGVMKRCIGSTTEERNRCVISEMPSSDIV
jgi:transposase